jgi:ribose transport system permease protein
MAVETIDKSEERKPGTISTIISRLLRFEEVGVTAALIVIGLLLTVSTEHFSEVTNLLQVARQGSYVGIMAVGMVFVISAGDIDLSAAAIFNLTTIVMAHFLENGAPLGLVLFLGLLAGAGCGLVNGGLSLLLRIPTIIVTLGTATIYHGFSLVISDATTISDFSTEGWFFEVLGGKFFGVVPGSVVLMVVVGVLGYLLFNHTAYGRHVCAIGANPQAARFAGIRVNRIRLLTMILMGVIAAFGAWALFAFLEAADPSTGGGSLMEVIAAAIIGGTSLAGGAGSVVGAIVGALIIAVIRNGLVLLGVSVYWQGTVTGAVIIGAVALDYIIKRRR